MSKQRATAVSWPIKPMPAETKTLLLDGSYSRAEYDQISLGLIPHSPADKWFIYLANSTLHFHRSGTGTAVFQLELVVQEAGIGATTVIVNQHPAQYRSPSDAYDVELIAYLVDHLLLGKFMPFPTPQNLAQNDRARHQAHVMGGQNGGGSLRLTVLNTH